MTEWLARLLIYTSAFLAPVSLRARWREEWLAEINAAPPASRSAMQMAGAPWDALTSRWTTRSRPARDGGGSWLIKPGEIKHAYRSLTRAPWYSLTIVGVIALTMALTTTVFAIVDGALFKPLPYRDVNRVYAMGTAYAKVPDSVRRIGVVSQVDLNAWREALPEAAFTAFYSDDYLNTGTDEIVPSNDVDAHFFDVIGMQPLTGGFEPGDFSATGKVKPTVITYAYWQRRFGGDRSVVGRSFLGEGGVGFRVAGILPADFVFPSYWSIPDALTPRIEETPPTRGRSLYVLARLSPTLSEPEASARLAAANSAVTAAWPVQPIPANVAERRRLMNGHFDVVSLQRLRAALTDLWSTTSWTVFWTSIALLVLACINVAGLALARLQDRWRELALRRSLGARYADITRLLAAENVVVIGAGTVAGIFAAKPTLAITVSLMSKSSQFLKTPLIDTRVLVFSVLLAAFCILVLTLISAEAAWRSSLRPALAEGGSTTRQVRRRGVSIISVQVALALIMAVGGALVAGSLMRVMGEDPGFDVTHTGIITVRSRVHGLSASDDEIMVDGLRRLPGITHLGGVNKPVLARAFNGSEFDRPPGVMETTIVESMAMTADYLPAAGLAPSQGRLPTAAEFESGAPVILVSDIVAHEYWPHQQAIGQSLMNSGRAFTVVGVVPDARYMSLDEEPEGAIYWPLTADRRPAPRFPSSILITLAGDGRVSLSDVVQSITRACPACDVLKAQMLTEALGTSIRSRRFNAWLFSAFGISALVIVGTGILGLVALTTNRRTREIGIRMALGATSIGVVRQILREQLRSVVIGLIIGGLVAAWAVRFVGAYLYKTQTYDAWAWMSAIAALLLIALVAGLLPSLRASRIDPVQALRVE